MSARHPKPLEGFHVLDFTNFLSGPYCTRILVDMGAEVICVEPPSGANSRVMDPFDKGTSIYHLHVCAGKKSVTLNLKTSAGRDAALNLGKHSDVIVENWRPGVARRLGLDYDTFAKVKPDIIYCSISGFGQTGSGAQRAAYAPIIEALSGFTAAQMALDGTDKPQTCGMMLADTLTSVWSFAAIQTALLHRERTGRGQYIDVAMLDTLLFALCHQCLDAQHEGRYVRRFHKPVKTADGYIIIAPVSKANFEALAQSIGHSEWIDEPRFATRSKRNANWATLTSLIEEWTSKRSTKDCEEIFQSGGVPCARIRTYAEAMRDPAVIARGTFATLEYPGGSYKRPNVPFQIPGTPTPVTPLLSEIGQHNAEVLGGILGYSMEKIQACAGESLQAVQYFTKAK